MKIVDKIALALVIIGAINWGLIGIFNFNLVDTIFGEMSIISRIVYSLVGISGLWCIRLLFTDNDWLNYYGIISNMYIMITLGALY